MTDPLEQLKKDQASTKRGRLKIYLGMAAGVGKTYGMLLEGKQELERGTDVVLGYLEPHGRAETDQMAVGLPTMPPRVIEHRGVRILDFDLEAALVRKPSLILVDELAHSNPEGSKHLKRWQDIEELLQAGINVITTVNIQHIESLRDVVAQITGVFVQETVPDAFFESTNEVELVDIPPEQLHQRLREGKVYHEAKVEQALSGFFKRGNLLALRELALRRTAVQVDKDLRVARTDLNDQEPWHASERILVCVAPNRMAARVVRSAKRIAINLHAEMLAVSVESNRHSSLSRENRDYQEQAMTLAEKLGAKTTNLVGDDIVAEVIAFARKENVTTIVMGKPIRNRWKEFAFGSVVDATIRASGDIDVLVITGAESQGTPIFRRSEHKKTNWIGYAEGLLVVAACTGIGFFLQEDLKFSNLIMLYLLGAVVISVRHGIRESVATTFLSIMAFNYCFIPPRFSFAISDLRFVFTFIVMMIVSVLMSVLTTRLRENSQASARRERTTAQLYDLSRILAESRKKDQMARLGSEKTSEILGKPIAILMKTPEGLTAGAPSATGFENEDNERAVAQWVIDHSQSAGKSTDTLAGAVGLYLPLIGSESTLGVLAIEMRDSESLDIAERHVVESISNQLSGALERAQFAKESHDAALQTETEQVRSDLLSAVSHDLRTPLASIEGSASALLSQETLSETGKELATTIKQESQRMTRLIQNLLDMTRVQGKVQLDLDWQNLEDIVANGIERTAPLFSHKVELVKPDVPILVKMDGVLMEQVMVNLLENAAKHAGKDSRVTIRLVTQGQRASLEVNDNGPGIPDAELGKIFDRFHQGSNSGFGLGLAICKAAVEAHGWTISAKNLHPGASFRIEIPLETPFG